MEAPSFLSLLHRALIVLALSFFLLIGCENDPRQIHARMLFLFPVVAGLIILNRKKISLCDNVSPAFILFLFVLIFQWIRALLGMVGFIEGSHFFLYAAVLWSFYFGVFTAYLLYCSSKRGLIQLSSSLFFGSFLVALNAIPALLLRGEPGYQAAGTGRTGFFWPFFYQWPWLEHYGVTRYWHVNIAGDVLVAGFFPALAMACYTVHVLRLRHRKEKLMPSDESFARHPFFLVLYLFIAFVLLSAILLLFSRGTILSLVCSLSIFVICLLAKFRKKIPPLILGVTLFAGLVFGTWAGNLPKAIRETLTVSQEKGGKGSSSMANVKGMQLSIALCRGHAVWGIGTNGYEEKSAAYDPDWVSGQPKQTYHLRAFSHYFQVLAEEGGGAFLYFLFLFAYVAEMIAGLWRTRSRVKFFFGLAFFCAAISFLIHAGFGFLMESPATSFFVYLLLGVSLAVVKKNFSHH